MGNGTSSHERAKRAGKEALERSEAKSDRPVEIEAFWAPKDPRDRLYDEDATGRERTMSMVRIIAAFHPVLNVFVLLGDMVRRAPLSTICVTTVLALLVYWFLDQPNPF